MKSCTASLHKCGIKSLSKAQHIDLALRLGKPCPSHCDTASTTSAHAAICFLILQMHQHPSRAEKCYLLLYRFSQAATESRPYIADCQTSLGRKCKAYNCRQAACFQYHMY